MRFSAPPVPRLELIFHESAARVYADAPCDTNPDTCLPEGSFIEEIHAENPVLIAGRYGRPSRIERPLHPDQHGIRVIQLRRVSEREIACDLLRESKTCRRCVRPGRK